MTTDDGSCSYGKEDRERKLNFKSVWKVLTCSSKNVRDKSAPPLIKSYESKFFGCFMAKRKAS